MSTIISASIDVSKIDKEKIQATDKDGNPWSKGQKYYYLDITINDQPDKFGNTVSICDKQTKEQRAAKEPRNYIGNGKVVWSSNADPAPPPVTKTKADDWKIPDSETLPF